MDADAQRDNAESSDGDKDVRINQGRWTREEHAMFLKGLKLHGKEWKRIADMIKTRTVVQIRTHAQKYFQKVAKSTGGPVMSTSKKGDVVRPPNRKQRKTGAAGDADSGEEEEKSGGTMADSGADEPPPAIASPSSAPRKPHSIRVPSFAKPAGAKGPGSLRIDSRKGDEGGGVTPRTVAAATILLRPRIQHKMQTGNDTPKTREQASWLDSQQEHASQILGKRRRSTPSNSASQSSGFDGPVLSWETAATNN